MKVDWVRAGRLLQLQRRAVEIDPLRHYTEIGVRAFGKGLFIKEQVSGTALGQKRVFTIRDQDLVVSNVFAWEGAVGLAAREHDGMVGSHRFMTWTPVGDVSRRYLCQYFLSDMGVGALGSASPGSAGRNRTLSIASFEDIEVPVPPRPDQDRIAAHLATLGAFSDTLSSASSLSQRLIQDASTDAPRRSIGSVMKASRDWIEIDPDASYRPIGIRGFGRGMIRYPETPASGLSKLRYYSIEPGSLLVSNIKAWEGAVCVAEESDAGRIGSNRFLQYQPTGDSMLPGWVQCYLVSPEGVAMLGAASPGSADRNRTLSMGGFEALEIPNPPMAVQRRIVALVAQEKEIAVQRAVRDRLASAILPAARNEIFSAMR